MFIILEDITVPYWNGQIFLTLIQNRDKLYLEVTNRNKLYRRIRIKHLKQGRLIANQIVPSLKKCEQYWEAHELLKIFFKKISVDEAIFLISTSKNRYSFEGLDFLSKVYHLRMPIYSGSQKFAGIGYDLSYDVYFKNKIKPIGIFAGYFSENFVFLLNEDYFNDFS